MDGQPPWQQQQYNPKSTLKTMGCIFSEERNEVYVQFRVSFNATLIPLFSNYKEVVMFLEKSQLFQHRTAQLQNLVSAYLADPTGFSKESLALRAIDSVHKLHPSIYNTDIVCLEWLVKACLRHQRFISLCHADEYSFQNSFRKYIQFLYLCYKEPNMIVIPKEEEAFMWHAHMQDARAYKFDMIKTLGRVLDYEDEFAAGELLKLKEETRKVRKNYHQHFKQLRGGIQSEHSQVSEIQEEDGEEED